MKTITHQLRRIGYDSKQIKHWNNILRYRGVKFCDIEKIALGISKGDYTIRFYTKFEDGMILEFVR